MAQGPPPSRFDPFVAKLKRGSQPALLRVTRMESEAFEASKAAGRRIAVREEGRHAGVGGPSPVHEAPEGQGQQSEASEAAVGGLKEVQG